MTSILADTKPTISPQEKMKAKMQKLGIPAKEIEVYGGQIVVTCWSEEAAKRWSRVIARFAKVKALVPSVDYNKDQQGRANVPLVHHVWRVFANIV